MRAKRLLRYPVWLSAEAGYRLGVLPASLRVRRPEMPVILSLHRVIPEADPGLTDDWVTVAKLDRLLRAMRSSGLTFVSMDEIGSRIENGRSLRGLAAITADDGFVDNRDHLVPLLRRHGVTATIYVCSTLVEQGDVPWTHHLRRAFENTTCSEAFVHGERIDLGGAAARRAACRRVVRRFKREPLRVAEELPAVLTALGQEPTPGLGLSVSQIRAMVAEGCVTFGSHGRRHLPLTACPADVRDREIRDSKLELEALTGVEVCHFAYPNYDVDTACMESVEQAGYRTAVTNVVRYRRLGDARRRSMALPRFVVGGHAWVGGNLLTMVRYGGGEA